jgi:hypothetical protein
MEDLYSFFSEEKLVKLLCKYRAKAANKRHAKHMISNVSLHQSSNKIAITNKDREFIFIQEKFPSRRDWKKLNEDERKLCKDSLKVNQKRLYKSYEYTKREIKQKKSPTPIWYKNLIDFVEEIRTEVLNIQESNYRITPPEIRGIKKEVKNGVIIYRPIALYNVKDKIICSLTAKYFTEYFEFIFSELNCSYAFRPINKSREVPNHHDCIQKILDNKAVNSKLWVAECDIQKFFDTVQHDHIIDVFDNLSKKVEDKYGFRLDSKAKKIFILFLSSFSFQEDILKLDEEWFEKNDLPLGEFEWVKEKLKEEFNSTYTNEYRIGVPQGNAISCFIANLILHGVDEKIKEYDPNLFYIRYCDDMILMHPEENKCSEALNIFMAGIKSNFLLFHKAKKIINYKKKSISHEFWKSKSKEPFFWGDKNVNERNVPWVSFVGYQIDFNGNIRVRKSTLKKETKKQVFETQKVLKALGKFNHRNEVKNENSRLAKRQIVFRTHQKLIAMSVGRLTIHNHKKANEQGLCWTNGFKKLSHNKISSKQLRYLDKRRHHQINRINRELSKINKEVAKSTFKDVNNIFFGAAYSYFNFLKYKK